MRFERRDRGERKKEDGEKVVCKDGVCYVVRR